MEVRCIINREIYSDYLGSVLLLFPDNYKAITLKQSITHDSVEGVNSLNFNFLIFSIVLQDACINILAIRNMSKYVQFDC